MEDARATIYSKDHCSACLRAQILLDQAGAEYAVIDLTGDLENAMRDPRVREALGI